MRSQIVLILYTLKKPSLYEKSFSFGEFSLYLQGQW